MRVRKWASIAALGALLLGAAGLASAQTRATAVHVAELSGVINPLSAEYLARVIADAEREGSAALVLRLDTPGGLDTAMRSMVQSILASRVPVIVYVAPPGARAASAGLFVTMAAHVAAMAPGTNIGAAHPVSLDGPTDPTTADKAVADASAYIRSLAETRHRNGEWAERAVRESAAASSSEALELKVVDLIAADLPELLRAIDARRVVTEAGPVTLTTAGATTVPVPMNFAERFLHVITDPNIALALLALGTIGIIAELYHPGALFPGIGGAISLILAWVALGSLPTNWAGAALLVLASVLLVAEVQTHGTGALAAAAALAFVLGSLLLFRPIGVPSPSAPDIGLNPVSVSATGAMLAGFVLIVLRAITRSRQGAVTSGPQGLIGALGTAARDLDPHGIVRIATEDWTAVAPDALVREGQAVRVVRVDGVTLVVEPATEAGVLPSAGLRMGE